MTRTFEHPICRTVAEIQRKVVKAGKRTAFRRIFSAKSDKDVIVAWRQDLNAVLNFFNVSMVDADLVLADNFFSDKTGNQHQYPRGEYESQHGRPRRF